MATLTLQRKGQFTIGEFLDAMEKNGWEKRIGGFVNTQAANLIWSSYDAKGLIEIDSGVIHSACSGGQAFLNLGLVPAIFKAGDGEFFSKLLYLNDQTELTVPEIARQLRKEFPKYLDEVIKIEGR